MCARWEKEIHLPARDRIVIRGARVHNLKNIDVEIPRHKMVVITGISGSGKSSLAFDTIYAEGQRRYVESLSAYARQFLGVADKPDVDYIEGLSPAISIELNPIEIAALPTVLPLPSLDMDSELNQLIVGLGQLESSLNKMGSAAQEIQRNQEKIADGCSQVAAGLGELEEGVKGAYEGSGQLAGGLEQLRQQLAASNEQLTQQLTELLAQQTQQTQELITQLYQLKQSIPSPQENPENYEAHVRIDALIKNLENPNNVPSLPSLPSQENDPLALLTDAVNMLNSGLGEIHQGTQRLAQETPSLSSGMKELAKGQGQLADGLLKAADGISTTKKESGGQFNELKRGQAVTDKLEILADDYKSFMDNTNNSNSQVQFLLRTEGIEITEPAAESAPEPTKNTPWQSIKNFFKNLFS
jgi:X-X-X-Leu-X-X-Gly heptad repeat protein